MKSAKSKQKSCPHAIPTYLNLLPQACGDEIRRLHQEKQLWIQQDKKGFLHYRQAIEALAQLRASSIDLHAPAVRIGSPEDLKAGEQEQLYQVLKSFMPWRKGPFSVFGIDIDAEWQSWRKWDRLVPALPDIQGKVVADVGCNNGYYMFRLAAQQPRLVLGFEPYIHHYFAFTLLNNFAQVEQLHVDLLGIEHLSLFPNSFDLILCLGVLYHRPSPIEALRDLHKALQPGGWLLLESQAINSPESFALFPEKTYAKVPGTWFIPTPSCLHNWLLRVGFTDIECFCLHPMNSREQRRTEWMVFESYQDFIDKHNPMLTIEGYPAPWRVFFKAGKQVLS